MSLKLYAIDGSPPCRSVYMTLEALGIQDKVTIEEVNPIKGDHLKPAFIKINPQHTIPVLVDGDFTLWDSHAINGYLVSKYGRNDNLYPKDPKKRAVIDSVHHFDNGYLFAHGINYMRSLFRPDLIKNGEESKQKLKESLDILETLLEQRTYVAGDELTIADFSVVSVISTFELSKIFLPHKHKKILHWLARMKELPYYHVNQKGVDTLKLMLGGKTQ